jgi:hypothetical protein
MINKIFCCLSKWIEFGISILKIEPFFDYLFNSLNNQKLFNEVSDCLIVIFTSPDALKYPSTFSRLLPYVVQLETLLDQSLTMKDKVDMIFFVCLCSNAFDSKDKAECITKLITQYGENLAQLIVQMSIASDPQSSIFSHHFCRLVMVSIYFFYIYLIIFC